MKRENRPSAASSWIHPSVVMYYPERAPMENLGYTWDCKYCGRTNDKEDKACPGCGGTKGKKY